MHEDKILKLRNSVLLLAHENEWTLRELKEGLEFLLHGIDGLVMVPSPSTVDLLLTKTTSTSSR